MNIAFSATTLASLQQRGLQEALQGIFDRRLVTTLVDDRIAETVSHDPADQSDPIPVVVPQGMQVTGGADVIVVSVGGEWIIGWVLR